MDNAGSRWKVKLDKMKRKSRAYFSFSILIIIIFTVSFFLPSSIQASRLTNELSIDIVEDESEPIPLRIAFDPNLPPFQFEQEGKYVGFNMDIIEAIAKNQRLELSFIPMNMEESIHALQTGEIDVILGINFSAELNKYMEFTERYFTSSVGILVAKENKYIENITDLSETVVSLQRGTVEYDFLRNIRRIQYQVTSNQINALRVLINGRSDAFVGNRMTAEYLLHEMELHDSYEFVDSYLLPLEYSLAVQKENYTLLQILNVGIRNIKIDGTYSDIYDRWFANYETLLTEQFKKIIQILSILFILAIVLFLLGIRWNRQLQREVEKKTQDLKAMNESLEYQVQQTMNSDQFKEQILDSSPRGVVTCNQEGIITSYNPIALQITGLHRKPIGTDICEVPMIYKLLSGKMSKVLKEGKQFLGEERVLKQQEKEFFMRYNVYPLYDFEKKINGIILTFEDITQERKLRDQVHEQEKSRALIQLVAGIAHEIRNPLTSIKTFVELIPIKVYNQKFQKEISTHVPKEIERLNQLVEGLINYAKPRSKQDDHVHINTLIHSSIILFERTIQNKGFRLETNIEENLNIEVDENQIKQVIINLILNAIEAMEEKQSSMEGSMDGSNHTLTLQINVSSTEEEVIIEIKDQGIGMTVEETKKVFEPFYTTKSSGTGLGLALTNQYINENHGTLNLESKKGEGTKIQIRFKKKEK